MGTSYSPLLLVLTILLAVLLMMSETATPALPLPDSEQHSSYFKYSVAAGFFWQDEPDTDPASFDFVRKPGGVCLARLEKRMMQD